MQRTLKYQIVYNNDRGGVLTVGNNGLLRDTLNLNKQDIEDMGNLIRATNGLLANNNERLVSTGKITHIDWFAEFEGCTKLEDISNLKYVGGHFNIKGTKIKSWPKDLYVRGWTTLPDGTIAHTLADARKWFINKFPQHNKHLLQHASSGSLAGGPPA